MGQNRSTLNFGTFFALEPRAAFATIIEELTLALAQEGLTFEAGPNGRVVEGNFEVARVVDWHPGASMSLEWHPADWQPDVSTDLHLGCVPVRDGTWVVVDAHGWEKPLNSQEELAGWFASEVIAPFLQATAPRSFGDWFTDRRARRPSGAQARAIYRDPLYHYPNFYAILALLNLTAADDLVEIGCGGGAFLKLALASGCRASAVDHSLDMVALAREVNADAVAEGRLTVEHASADKVPFPEGRFTCAVMTGVFGFLPDPVAALREMHRVLAPGGRVVVMGSDAALRGTPAAPEPMASRLRFYEDEPFAAFAREAGFTDARVVREDLHAYAVQAGIPEEDQPLFGGAGAPFLVARKGAR